MKMALAHTGLVQKVMEKVMPQSWAVGRSKIIPMRRSPTQRRQVLNERPDSALSPGHPSGVYPTPWLGLLGLTVTPDVALAMNLASDQRGVLVEQVQQQGPADRAHLREGSQAFVNNGHRRLVGGDIIVALDGQPVSRLKDMQTFLQPAQPGQTVTLTLLRGKEQIQVQVTCARGPASILSPSLEMMLQREPSYTPKGCPVPRTPFRGGDSDLGVTF
jgi:S1-C subfamily serine protease